MNITTKSFCAKALAAALFGVAGVALAAVSPGTYEGAAQGKFSPVKASVTLNVEGRITDIQVDVSRETPELGGTAAKTLVPRMLAGQSVNVDAVSGATVSSEAIKMAVMKAIEKSGADPARYQVKVEKKAGPDETMSADVVVVGAGAAGTAAALAAAESGVRVIVLEKTPTVGGAGKLAQGLFATESSLQKAKFKDDPALLGELTNDRLFTYLMDYNHFLSNARVTRRVIDLSGSTIDWMQKYGQKLELVDWNPQQGQNPYPIRWRIYHRYTDKAAGFKAMYEALGQMGGTLLTSTRAYDLTQDDEGNVTAVIAEKSDGSKLTIKTKAVILASGGFGGNLERVKEMMETENLTNRIAWSNNGEGLEMAWKAGAKKMGEHHALMHACELEGLSNRAAGVPGQAGKNLITRFLKTPLMWVDESGHRFANEELVYDTVYWTNAAYSVGGRYYIVVDSKTIDAFTEDKLPFELSGAGPVNPKGRADFRTLADEAVAMGVGFRGETLEDLGKTLGFRGDFPQEVARYNEAVRTGRDPMGKPADFLKFTIESGPFYAFRAKAVSLSTLGGVRVDENMQAIGANYKPIGGLYAVGNNAYGFYTTPSYPPYQGLALGFAYNSGRIAGMEAAKAVKASK